MHWFLKFYNRIGQMNREPPLIEKLLGRPMGAESNRREGSYVRADISRFACKRSGSARSTRIPCCSPARTAVWKFNIPPRRWTAPLPVPSSQGKLRWGGRPSGSLGREVDGVEKANVPQDPDQARVAVFPCVAIQCPEGT